MPRRKPAAPPPPDFPPEVCGVCRFWHNNKCWQGPPLYSHTDEDGEVAHVPRGAKQAPLDPACREFKPRLHA